MEGRVMQALGINCRYRKPWPCLHQGDDHSVFGIEGSRIVVGYVPDRTKEKPQHAVNRWLSIAAVRKGDSVKRQVTGLHGFEWAFTDRKHVGTTVAWRAGEGVFVAGLAVSNESRLSNHRGVLERILRSGKWGEAVDKPAPSLPEEPSATTEVSLAVKLRGELQLSPFEFGRVIGAHRDTVLRWERGESRPTSQQMSMMQCFENVTAKHPTIGEEISHQLKTVGSRFALFTLTRAASSLGSEQLESSSGEQLESSSEDRLDRDRLDRLERRFNTDRLDRLERRVQAVESTLALVSAPFEEE